ncbi:MAG TPA: multidrug ABC transporter ATP-binding protein [Parvularcula sp.]|nr:multidrug ABC transporter ATP-binding protein [Parvularcula sp.]HBS36079.1 multidrug ABC transporter ATP-binding protein [Parvularcula sp.]
MFRFFESRLPPFPETRLGAPPQGLAAFCWHYVQDARWWLLSLSLLTAAIAVGEVYLFAFLGSIVDWLANAERDGFLTREAGKLLSMGLLLVIGLPAAALAHSLVQFQALIGNLPMSARWRMHRHLLGQSMGFFANEFAGRVATKVMQTSLAVREAVMKLLDVFVYVTVYFFAMIAMVAAADWRLALPLLLWLAAYIGLISYFIPRLKDVAEKQADARSVMTGRIVDSYTNIATVKLFAHAGREEAFARESMEEFLATVHPQMRLVTLFNNLVYFNNCLAVFVIAGLSISLWLGSVISVGAIAASIALALRLNGMSQWIMWEVSGLFENIGTVYDGMGMLAKSAAVEDRPGAAVMERPRGDIAYEGVAFHYGKDGGVIDDFTLAIPAGEKVGLVGRSGAGKTTLVNLLLRFYDPERGRILIDGADIASVSQSSLRAQIGVVTQDTSLLHRSIRENIAYGRPGANDDAVREAARRANALDFIEALEDGEGRKGFDAHVGERGVKLSGGQRQRIAIARVFLKDAPILVLDEATSALDSEVEAAIQENLFALMRGKTVIAIAHRLSTIAQLDRLVVIDKGRIVEAGPHASLVAKGGLYAELWARQSGGFIAHEGAVAAE